MSESQPPPPKTPDEQSSWERRIETVLWRSRFLVLLAVVPSLLGSIALFVVGTLDIVSVVLDVVRYYLLDSSQNIHDTLVPDIIIAVDIYLIAIVLLIFSLGIYRLFVSRIDQAEARYPRHPFNVASLDQLKDKITRVVILAVIIEFFRAVVDIRFTTPLEAIYLALSVLALAATLYLMSQSHKKE
ncbi:YqhA family protein [Halomonas sp. PAMB 3264]|uniref:YqhA family protein n=1 Tax=unclassified Halomonas TaxID=2609666 RepID=UPI00289A601B|nr:MULTISPECIES: YqhA family protein [unclassified Halomonas]WNL38507.1 YqhA family protein [Halomonas sp. PAMB 3232]WNL41807.1 YqhA family protein [Halomonas sp. PAMB 3264]